MNNKESQRDSLRQPSSHETRGFARVAGSPSNKKGLRGLGHAAQFSDKIVEGTYRTPNCRIEFGV